jgi:hypothetical protein
MCDHVQSGTWRILSVCRAHIRNMVPFRHFTRHRGAVLFLLLLPSALSVPYHDLGEEDDGE